MHRFPMRIWLKYCKRFGNKSSSLLIAHFYATKGMFWNGLKDYSIGRSLFGGEQPPTEQRNLIWLRIDRISSSSKSLFQVPFHCIIVNMHRNGLCIPTDWVPPTPSRACWATAGFSAQCVSSPSTPSSSAISFFRASSTRPAPTRY